MDELGIKKSVIVCFREFYDKVNLSMDKLSETFSHKKVETLVLQAHIAWCCHFKEIKEYDVPQTYKLSNHAKVFNKERNEKTTSKFTSFHCEFSVSSALVTMFKLKLIIVIIVVIANQWFIIIL